MTSMTRRLSVRIQEMILAFQKTFDDISKATGRIFSPSDDDYPKSGVQPFEGDIPDGHQRHSSW
ncbi:MAG: hypothetical protein F6K42_18160 [Leptolyngbya sp. SIO1D8]|nr:hypothetical protein [Leptolyngbya sp. SIO1D8]